MNSKPNASGNDRVYEDYEPPSEWLAEEDSHTLIVFLPGFTREKLRVQITVPVKLRLSGERHVSENKWQRFSKEFPIPSDSNIDRTAANFESGVLYIKLPKAIPTTTNTLQEQTKKPTEEPHPSPQKPPSDESQTQKKGMEEKAAQKKPSDIKKNTSDTNEIKEVTNDFVRDSDEKRLKNGEGKGKGETKEMNDTAMCCNLRPQGSKEGVKSLVKETKKKRLINLIVAVLFLLVIGLYVKNGIFKSKDESKRTEL